MIGKYTTTKVYRLKTFEILPKKCLEYVGYLVKMLINFCFFPNANIHMHISVITVLQLVWIQSSLTRLFPCYSLFLAPCHSKSLQKSHLLCFLQQQSPDAPPAPPCSTSAFLILVVWADILAPLQECFSEHSYPVCQPCQWLHTQNIFRFECLPFISCCCHSPCGHYQSRLDYRNVCWDSSHFGPWLSIVCSLLSSESKPLNIHFPSFHFSAQNSAPVSTFHFN